MSQTDLDSIPRPTSWSAGQWEKLQHARAAQVGLIIALRRGLGIVRAIEVARETAGDPRTSVLGDKSNPDASGETFAIHPPVGWAMEISYRDDTHWRLKVQAEPDLSG